MEIISEIEGVDKDRRVRKAVGRVNAHKEILVTL